MTAIIFIAAAALIMTELLSRTKKPKSFAVLNAAAGIAALIGISLLLTGSLPRPGWQAAAISAALGVPGAALCALLGNLI